MSTEKRSEGFTIIEVVLVLAIAALIFLMVFFAVPAAFRGQRDEQRRVDVARISSQITNYSVNNRSAVPSDQSEIDSFKTDYMKSDQGEFNDPKEGRAYTLTYKNGNVEDSTVPGATTIFMHVGGKCSGEKSVPGGAQEIAIRVALEGGGVFCHSTK